MSGSVLKRRLFSAILTLLLFFIIQNVITILHEHAHSTSAWLLGYSPSPFTVVWGDLIMIKGWDEGVPYDRLFPVSGNVAEAVIGGIPLLMHTIFTVVSLYVLHRLLPGKRAFVFFAFYWFAVFNFAELVAYVVMRPFITTGDTGRFNHGMALSPWVLFIVGTLLLILGLWNLARKVGPRIDSFTDGSGFVHAAVVLMTAFILFLWGSGLRMMLLYPDPQWRVGLLGIVAFIGWILIDRYPASHPSRQSHPVL